MLDAADDDQGRYTAMAQKILVHPKNGDGFIVGAHEAAHARDALISQKMPGFEEADLDKAYNLHSTKVLAEAKKALGLKANSREYADLLTQIFGNSAFMVKKYKNRPDEIVAYAIDYEASGMSNELSKAIAERLGK